MKQLTIDCDTTTLNTQQLTHLVESFQQLAVLGAKGMVAEGIILPEQADMVRNYLVEAINVAAAQFQTSNG
jgi:hypothetical protein